MLPLFWYICLIRFLFPLLDVWGRFTQDELRFFCSLLLTDGSYRYFIGRVFSVLTVSTILFCYVEILWKFKASTVNTLKNENILRSKKKNNPRLVRSIVCFITVYCALIFPLMLVTIVYPEMKNPFRHTLQYFTLECPATLSILWFIRTQQENKFFVSEYYLGFFPKKNHSVDLDETASQQTPYRKQQRMK